MKTLSGLKYCFPKSICAAMAIGALSAALPVHAQETVELKLADRLPAEHFLVKQGLDVWIDGIEKASNGTVKIRPYHAQQLGKGKDSLLILKNGIAQIVEMSPGLIGQEMQLSSVTELPLATGACQGAAAYEAILQPGTALDKAEGQKNGTVLLISMTVAPYNIFTTKDLNSLGDLKGLKIATQGPVHEKVIERLGAVPVRIAASETYDAVTRGTVDGVSFPVLSARAYDLARHIKTVLTGGSFGQSGLAYFISREAFEKLPPETQASMIDLGKDASRKLCAYTEQEDAKYLATMKEGGTKLLALSPEDAASMNAALQPLAAEWAAEMDGKGLPGTQVLEDYRAALKVE